MGSEVDLIKERLDVADVIGEYVSLKRAGHHFKALCPFHQEKTPSFIVSPSKGIWHCFGCQKGGDIFSFIQEKEGLDFAGALHLLAERAGVSLSRSGSAGRSRGMRLLELLALSARFYHEVLMSQPAGKRALAYMTSERGVTPDLLRRFQVGYAPHRWDSLFTFVRSRGYSPAEALAVGLVGQSGSGKLYDRFRGRIMFPIADVHGKIVAFGGRIVPWHATGDEGKYVNSPETELYEKRRIVFNLERAKRALRDDTPLIVVEGYLDVMLLVQIGVENVVAVSGTAFTADHASQLARFTRCLHFVFDPDTAGVKAALTATRTALAAGLRAAVVLLPAGMDPADMARADAPRLRELLAQPMSLPALLLEQLKRTKPAAAREVWLGELLSAVRLVTNPVQQGEMIRDVAALLHVPEAQIMASLRRQQVSAPGRNGDGTGAREHDGDHQASPVRPEHLLLGLALGSPAVWPVLATVRAEDAEHFDLLSRSLYNMLQGLVNTSQQQLRTMSADAVLALVPSELLSFAEGVRRLSEERLEHSPESAEAEARQLVLRIRQRTLEERLHALHRSLGDGDGAVRERTLRQFQELTEELAHLHLQR